MCRGTDESSKGTLEKRGSLLALKNLLSQEGPERVLRRLPGGRNLKNGRGFFSPALGAWKVLLGGSVARPLLSLGPLEDPVGSLGPGGKMRCGPIPPLGSLEDSMSLPNGWGLGYTF